MTETEFSYKASKLIHQELIKEVNQIIGVSKASQSALTLLLNAKLNIEVRKIPSTNTKDKKLKVVATNCVAYLKHDEDTIVISLFYSKASDLPKLLKSIEKHTWYFTYLYLRELFMLTRGYNTITFYKKVKRIIQNSGYNIDKQYYQALMNVAGYISINNFLYSLYKSTNNVDNFLKAMKYAHFVQDMNNKDYFTILDFVLKEAKTTHNTETTHLVDINDVPVPTQMVDYPLVHDEYDEIVTDLGETIENAFKVACRGVATASIFGQEFKADDKVKTGWFKKLKKTLSRVVYYKTNNFEVSWGSLNSTYKHKFKAPKQNYKDTSLELVLSIDQSGSMQMEELGRIAGVIKKQSKNINKLTVLIHDTEITKVFTLKPEELDVNSDSFKKALLTRYSTGGTSHYHVFDWLVNNVKDFNKLIYLSYSDNYSDIPEALDKFKQLKQAEMVFICTINNPLNIKGTTDITLE